MKRTGLIVFVGGYREQSEKLAGSADKVLKGLVGEARLMTAVSSKKGGSRAMTVEGSW